LLVLDSGNDTLDFTGNTKRLTEVGWYNLKGLGVLGPHGLLRSQAPMIRNKAQGFAYLTQGLDLGSSGNH
jgi:hypothetical protein